MTTCLTSRPSHPLLAPAVPLSRLTSRDCFQQKLVTDSRSSHQNSLGFLISERDIGPSQISFFPFCRLRSQANGLYVYCRVIVHVLTPNERAKRHRIAEASRFTAPPRDTSARRGKIFPKYQAGFCRNDVFSRRQLQLGVGAIFETAYGFSIQLDGQPDGRPNIFRRPYQYQVEHIAPVRAGRRRMRIHNSGGTTNQHPER